MEDNIFAGNSCVHRLAQQIYNSLMTRRWVTYSEELAKFLGKDISYIGVRGISNTEHFEDIKKAFPWVIKILQAKIQDCIENDGKRKGKSYRYVGTISDPLRQEREYSRKLVVEDYVQFCKATNGMLPAGWISSFFEGSNLELESEQDAESGSVFIGSSLEQNLTNIEMLPDLYSAISNHNVISFDYKPFDKDVRHIILHPQFLKEYNGRWFVLGKVNGGDLQVEIFPIDRMISNPRIVSDIDYVPAANGFYKNYFSNIVGVSYGTDSEAKPIVIRTYSEYQHGLLMTKKLHHSQEETVPFGRHDGKWYGEVKINVIPNHELRGKILTFGHFLEVVSPEDFRKEMAEVTLKTAKRYNQ